MPSTLDLCEKYFETRSVYELFDLTKDSTEKDIKKAYYRLSLKVHPDRVSDDEKEIATEKFKVLTALYQVLTDKNKKALYDEQGIIDDDDDGINIEQKISSWLELWKNIFKPISVEDIDNFKREYVGSEMERMDIKKAYLNGKGCINYMTNCVPFMSIEDEPRIQEIVKEMIKSEEVPEYKIFINEPKSKRDRRHKKYAKEKSEAENILKTMKTKDEDTNLEKQLMERSRNREAQAESFFNHLLEKYGEDDDSNEVDLKKLKTKIQKRSGKKGKTTAPARNGAKAKTVKASTSNKKIKNTEATESTIKMKKSTEKGVKSGRVTKKRK